MGDGIRIFPFVNPIKIFHHNECQSHRRDEMNLNEAGRFVVDAVDSWVGEIDFPRSCRDEGWFSETHAKKTIRSQNVPEFEPFSIPLYFRLVWERSRLCGKLVISLGRCLIYGEIS